MKKVMVTLCLSLGLSSCYEQDVSNLNDLATPGLNFGFNELLWQNEDTIFLGSCEEGKEPNRDHCTVTNEASFRRVTDLTFDSILADITPAQKRLDEEIKALRDSAPLVLDIRAKVEDLTTLIAEQKNRISEVIEDIDDNSRDIEALGERITSKNTQISEIEERLPSAPNKESLLVLRNQLITERDQLKVDLRDLEDESQSLQNRLEDLERAVLGSELRRQEQLDELSFQLETLEVSSAVTKKELAFIARLQAQADSMPSLFEYISLDGLVFREKNLSDIEKEVLARLMKILKGNSDLPFYENFGTANLDSFHWSTYASLASNTNRVVDGQFLMDASNNGINELILRLPNTRSRKLVLSFYQIDLDDRETRLPSNFTGSARGDGVSLSVDGRRWYTLVNADELNTPNGFNFEVNLYEKILSFESRFRVSLDPSDGIWIKFQQFEASRYQDARAWDNIRVESIK
ncbi:MAG: hypothetical protein HRU19_23270 [Pseudobacteriovorax sp.]|nr:hypothetical protein [Pseudobacteriovorax sp.]